MFAHVVHPVAATLAIALFAAVANPARAADDKAVDGATKDCVQIVQINNTRIIDDQNIVFEMRGNKFYNNRLPNKCPGLKSANKFSYKTSQSVLCNVDSITVLLDAGSSLMRGASCGLGSFTPTEDPDKVKADAAAKKAD